MTFEAKRETAVFLVDTAVSITYKNYTSIRDKRYKNKRIWWLQCAYIAALDRGIGTAVPYLIKQIRLAIAKQRVGAR